jgi:phosphatidylglycerophosphate synthase
MVLVMKLHHTSGVPDWAQRDPEVRNQWQRLAAMTYGILTPANIASVLGFVLVGLGVLALFSRQFGWGVALIAVGRCFDIADGWIAERTGTKSPLGEAVDATFDKLSTLGVLLAVGTEHIVPWWVVGIIAVHHTINSVVAYIGWRRKLAMRPVLAGKLSTVLEWVALCAFMLAVAHQSSWLWLAYIALAPALWLGVVASISYVRLLFVAPSAASVAATRARRA